MIAIVILVIAVRKMDKVIILNKIVLNKIILMKLTLKQHLFWPRTSLMRIGDKLLIVIWLIGKLLILMDKLPCN